MNTYPPPPPPPPETLWVNDALFEYLYNLFIAYAGGTTPESIPFNSVCPPIPVVFLFSLLHLQKSSKLQLPQDTMSVQGQNTQATTASQSESLASASVHTAHGGHKRRSGRSHKSPPHHPPRAPATTPKLEGCLLEPSFQTNGLVNPMGDRPTGYMSSNTRMASRENPWVYRYKVKRNMNEINKILTNKGASVDYTDSTYMMQHDQN